MFTSMLTQLEGPLGLPTSAFSSLQATAKNPILAGQGYHSPRWQGAPRRWRVLFVLWSSCYWLPLVVVWQASWPSRVSRGTGNPSGSQLCSTKAQPLGGLAVGQGRFAAE